LAANCGSVKARLGKLCGNGADLWLTLQARYDALEATQRFGRAAQGDPDLREE
jgi:plasmid maintenance system antidote protein VapI